MHYNSGQNREGDYEHYVVQEEMPLLEWLIANVPQSKSKIKATLSGRGIKVNGKTVSQFDFALKPGMKVSVSKTKRNQQGFKSRWVKIVYEDRWLIVVEKGLLPDDMEILGRMVEDISYNNARRYFKFY